MVRQDDEIGCVTDGVDADISFAVGGEDVEANGLFGLQLHKIAMHKTLIVGLYLYVQPLSQAFALVVLFVVSTMHPDRTARSMAGRIGLSL